jgi:3-methylcrotonyl-CoA carboxylase beta subunit
VKAMVLAEYGKSLECAYARIGGWPCGIVANQRKLTERKMPGGKAGPSKAMNMPAVIYDDSADKAARFIMDCNQKRIPIVFVHDTTGFMVGRDSEQAGIIRSGAKMVNALSNCIVPKIALIVGHSYGAGNYAMCGRAYSPRFLWMWPNARISVMGGEQAATVLATIRRDALEARGETWSPADEEAFKAPIREQYEHQGHPYYSSARLWDDGVIDPLDTRMVLGLALSACANAPIAEPRYGVFRM